MKNKYAEYDCVDRADYLQYLANEYDIELEVVAMIADLCGIDEEFDGLVTTLQDMA